MKSKKNEKVKISIVSERGDDTVVLAPLDAVNRVKEEVSERGKWLYLDGKYTSADTVTEEDLKEANDIVLGDTLVGG